jgi:hypothetical protein
MCPVLAGDVKFSLQVLLSDLQIPQGHADVFVSEQLHKGGKTDAQTEHLTCETVAQGLLILLMNFTQLRFAIGVIRSMA